MEMDQRCGIQKEMVVGRHVLAKVRKGLQIRHLVRVLDLSEGGLCLEHCRGARLSALWLWYGSTIATKRRTLEAFDLPD